jgi:hypothetical protein
MYINCQVSTVLCSCTYVVDPSERLAISNRGSHFGYAKGRMDVVNSVCDAMQKHPSTGKRQKERGNTSFPLLLSPFAGSNSICIEECKVSEVLGRRRQEPKLRSLWFDHVQLV